MPPMRRDVDISRVQEHRCGLVFESEPRLTLQDQNPLGLRLVVPESWRARLTRRNDAFYPDCTACQQLVELLGGVQLAQILEKIRRTLCLDRLLHQVRQQDTGAPSPGRSKALPAGPNSGCNLSP
jgi:hypothetical protein